MALQRAFLKEALEKFNSKAEIKKESAASFVLVSLELKICAANVLRIFEETKRRGVLIGKGGLLRQRDSHGNDA